MGHKTTYFAAALAATAAVVSFAVNAMEPDQSITTHPIKQVDPADQRVIPFPGHTAIPLIESRDTQGGVSFLQFGLPAKTFGAPPHIHSLEDEYAIVMQGEVRILTENGIVTAKEGTVATLPRGSLHGFWNNSDQPATLIFAISNPAGFETFFDKVVENIRAENPGSPQEVGAIIGKTAAAYNVTVYPEKTPAEAAALMPK